LLIGKLK